MIKTITVLLNFAFKWLRLVTRTIGLVQAGEKVNQLASAIDRACNKFYRKLRKQKFIFFSRLKRDVFFNFCVS